MTTLSSLSPFSSPTVRFGPTTPPPAGVPTPPASPITRSGTFVTDLTEASRLAARAIEMINTVPRDDVGSETTKDLRIRIFKTNMAVQSRLERQLGATTSESVLSQLRTADAYLEDANWQLAKKPSPDGRFNGVDIPGALRDTMEGARLINEMLSAAGGTPSVPSVPAPGPTPVPPTLPPTLPPTPPTTPPATPPALPPAPSLPPALPPAPTTPPPAVPPTQGPGSPTQGSPDSDYPGEDEFPNDDDIRNGGGSGSGGGGDA